MMEDVKQPMILRTSGSPFGVFVREMKGSPDTPVRFAVAKECDLFGRDLRNSERIEQKNQLTMFLSGNERAEISSALRGIDVGERAQFGIVAKLFAQQLLIVAKEVGGFVSLRSGVADFRVRGSFDFFHRLIGKSNDQM